MRRHLPPWRRWTISEVVICDSVDREVQQSLRDSAAAASAARRERIAVAAGGAGETVTELLERA